MKRIAASFFLSALTFSAFAVNIQQQADGKYHTSVLNNGSSGLKYDIVFIGDGFTSADQNTFNDRVNDALNALRSLSPFNQNICAFNIWRVNVISSQSGVDHPANNTFKNTELDCKYGDPSLGEAIRCIGSSSPAKCYEAAMYAPAYDAIFVFVNDEEWGGCAGDLVFSSISPGFTGIVTHELGHKMGHLADEYTCYVCDGSDDDVTYSGPEPTAPNLTTNTDRATTKWASRILSTTPIPTTFSALNTVGLFEGGGYCKLGIYRPQVLCQMSNSYSVFCAVCADVLSAVLTSHCTFCELNPALKFCIMADLRVPLVALCTCPIHFLIPPVCLSCPPEKVIIEDRIIINSADAKISTVHVYDPKGNEVKNTLESNADGTTTISFTRNRFLRYSLEITPLPHQGNKANLSFGLRSMII